MKEYSLLELQEGLDNGLWTSCDLLDMYLERIYKYDQNGPKLNSIAEINPDAYFIAKRLDIERKTMGKRSYLHGIPIVVKDNINTRDKMHTTAGSLALSDLYASYDATIIKKLRDAGMIILGKANLSEFAYFMSNKAPSGFSSRSGQVKSPYHEKIDPLGSSTGSAVSVAANLIPASIGTETNGSLMAPALQNLIVSMKPTMGLVSRHGIIPITNTQDTAGPMGRTVEDCALLMDIIYGKDNQDEATLLNPKLSNDFKNAIHIPVKGMKVGILYYNDSKYNEDEYPILSKAKEVLETEGMKVIDLKVDRLEIKNYLTLLYEFKPNLNYYLSTVRGSTKMTSLEDIIHYNDLDPMQRAPYGQDILVAADKLSGTLKESEYYDMKMKNQVAANQFNRLLDEYQLDAIISPYRTSHAPVAGNPCISVPSLPLNDLKPHSLIFVGKMWDDERLLAISYAYEQRTKFRNPPKLE